MNRRPMKCNFCSQHATVHISGVWDGQQHDLHLCRRCAKEKFQQALGLGEKLRELVDHVIKHGFDHVLEGERRHGRQIPKRCGQCGMSFRQFAKQGRLGCPADYETFRPALDALLKELHGSTRHRGKRPKRYSQGTLQFAPRIGLRRHMFAAAEREDYEKAIRLRELMRRKGQPHGSD